MAPYNVRAAIPALTLGKQGLGPTMEIRLLERGRAALRHLISIWEHMSPLAISLACFCGDTSTITTSTV